MADPTATVRSVLIPVTGSQLLILPNAAVAEIINFTPPQPAADAPAWLVGTIEWRGYTVPTVVFEALCGCAPQRLTRSSRIVVCNTISGGTQLPFVGILAATLPRLIRIDGDSLEIGDGDAEVMPGVLRQIQIYGEDAIIPDLDALETMCLAQLGAAAVAGNTAGPQPQASMVVH